MLWSASCGPSGLSPRVPACFAARARRDRPGTLLLAHLETARSAKGRTTARTGVSSACRRGRSAPPSSRKRSPTPMPCVLLSSAGGGGTGCGSVGELCASYLHPSTLASAAYSCLPACPARRTELEALRRQRRLHGGVQPVPLLRVQRERIGRRVALLRAQVGVAGRHARAAQQRRAVLAVPPRPGSCPLAWQAIVLPRAVGLVGLEGKHPRPANCTGRGHAHVGSRLTSKRWGVRAPCHPPTTTTARSRAQLACDHPPALCCLRFPLNSGRAAARVGSSGIPASTMPSPPSTQLTSDQRVMGAGLCVLGDGFRTPSSLVHSQLAVSSCTAS